MKLLYYKLKKKKNMLYKTESINLETDLMVKTTMKAAILASPGNFEITQSEIPELEKDEVLIRVEGCGICASNIPVFEGREWFTYPMPAGNPGHEAWGEIVKKGSKVKMLEVGDKVAALSYNGFAEFDKANEKNVVKLPEGLKGECFPGEPLGCAMNIFKRSDIRKGQTVAIVGIGFLGALLIQMAKEAGAKVIALSKRKYSLEIAREAGADELVALDDNYKVIEKVSDLTKGKFCDRVIEATGKEWPLNLAGELTAERGRLIIAGFHQDGMRQVNVQLWNWKGIDVINAHERDPAMYVNGMKMAAEAVLALRLNPKNLYTHNFKIEDINKAFNMLIERPDGYMKALITF
jgi:threonine dehydrogenase-like Zn-dependent dehydrogenase